MVRFLISILNIKIIAIYLGPQGMALVSQFQNFLQLSTTIGSLDIYKGQIKYISQYKDSPFRKNLVYWNSIVCILASSIIISTTVFFLSDKISQLLFNTSEYTTVIKYSGIYVITFSVFNWIISVFNGLKKLRLYILINITHSITSFITILICLKYFGTYGILWAILFQFPIALALGIRFFLKNQKSFKIVISKYMLRQLLKYAFVALFTTALTPITTIIIRNLITESLSAFHAGIWEGANKISNNYIMLITLTFNYYFLPTFSQINKKEDLLHEIKEAYKIIIPITVFITIAIITLREPIIRILFTKEFLSISDIITWQSFGDIFKILAWILAILLIAKEKFKTFVFVELLSCVLQITLAYLMIPLLGTKGMTMYYFIENVLYFAVLLLAINYYWGNFMKSKKQ